MASKGFWKLMSTVGLAEVEQDEALPSPAQAAEAAAPPQPRPQPTASPAAAAPPPPVASGREEIQRLDQQAKQMLLKAITDEPTHIFDDFGDALESLEDAIPDEGARYKASINLLTKKHTLDAIVGDFDKCVGVVDRTQQNFEQALGKQREARVGAREREVEKLESEISTLDSQIQQLNERKAQARTERDEAKQNIAAEQHHLDLTKERFEAAYQSVRAGLESQKALILKHSGKAAPAGDTANV